VVAASNREHEIALVRDVMEKILKLKIKNVINKTALVVGRVGADAPLSVVKESKLGQDPVKGMIAVKIWRKEKIVTNKTA